MSRVYAYLSEHSPINGKDLAVQSQDALAAGLYLSPYPDAATGGYVLVGHAEVHVTLLPHADAVALQVSSLRAEAQKIQAEAGAQVTRIEAQINSLLAIENCTVEAQS